MAGLDPAIHAFLSRALRAAVDARHKAGHDETKKSRRQRPMTARLLLCFKGDGLSPETEGLASEAQLFGASTSPLSVADQACQAPTLGFDRRNLLFVHYEIFLQTRAQDSTEKSRGSQC
jgi:hypothetical protein